MKNKKLILILIVTITVIAAATVLSACNHGIGKKTRAGSSTSVSSCIPQSNITSRAKLSRPKAVSLKFTLTTKNEGRKIPLRRSYRQGRYPWKHDGSARRHVHRYCKIQRAFDAVQVYRAKRRKRRIKCWFRAVGRPRRACVFGVGYSQWNRFSDFIGMKFVIKYRDTKNKTK